MMEFSPVEVIEERPKSIKVWFVRHECSEFIGKSQLRPGSVQHVGERGKLVVDSWLGKKLIENLGVEEARYENGYTDGVKAGYRSGYGAGRDKGAAEALELAFKRAQDVYRNVMFQWHPDRGGDGKAATALNQLWQAMRAALK